MNSGVTLPSSTITVVHRSDSSGTSFIFSSWLNSSNAHYPWKLKVSKTPNWAGSTQATYLSLPQNVGVAGGVQQNPNTIGYVELNYVLSTTPQMYYASVLNGAGSAYVLPSLTTSTNAVNNSTASLPTGDGDWSKVTLLNAPGGSSYSIVSFTYVLVFKELSVFLVRGSVPVLESFGTGFFTGKNWIAAAGSESYSALPFVLGTLVTSAIAVAVGVPLSIGIAIFLAEMAPWSVRNPLSRVIELLAAVPSIVYGLWGLFVFRLWIRDYLETPISNYVGSFPVFQGTPLGLDFLTAGLILAIMIIPTVSSISNDVMMAVPASQREAAYSIGATRW